MRLEELVPSISIMLKMVAPDANYEQISRQILQNWLGENLGDNYSQPKNFFKFEFN